jgi:hypothetical protein
MVRFGSDDPFTVAARLPPPPRRSSRTWCGSRRIRHHRHPPHSVGGRNHRLRHALSETSIGAGLHAGRRPRRGGDMCGTQQCTGVAEMRQRQPHRPRRADHAGTPSPVGFSDIAGRQSHRVSVCCYRQRWHAAQRQNALPLSINVGPWWHQRLLQRLRSR